MTIDEVKINAALSFVRELNEHEMVIFEYLRKQEAGMPIRRRGRPKGSRNKPSGTPGTQGYLETPDNTKEPAGI